MRAALAARSLGLAIAGPAQAAEQQTPVRIGAIEARLWYQFSGRLSKNLLAGKEPFVGWNTIIGEGPVEEPASDMLVDVAMIGGGGDESFTKEPLDVWVTGKGGKTVAKRRFEGLLLPLKGGLHNVVWLADVACAGKLTIHAKFGKQTKTASLALDCGE